VACSAMRLIACAGGLATGLLMGAAAGIAFADTGDAASSGSATATVTSKSDENNSDPGATSASNPDHPTSTVGNGRADVDVKTTEEEKKNNPSAGTRKFKGSISIPIPRIPEWDELAAGGLPNPGLFLTTIVIPVPTLADGCAGASHRRCRRRRGEGAGDPRFIAAACATGGPASDADERADDALRLSTLSARTDPR
jgi:hypothetical protein